MKIIIRVILYIYIYLRKHIRTIMNKKTLIFSIYKNYNVPAIKTNANICNFVSNIDSVLVLNHRNEVNFISKIIQNLRLLYRIIIKLYSQLLI